MNLREIVKKLQDTGTNVSFRERKDGSIRITAINGIKFKASQGNAYARKLTGEQLSERRVWQLQSRALATPKGQWGHKKRTNLLDDRLRKKLRRVQRLYRQKGIEEGFPTVRNVDFTIRTYGYKEALERLTQAERYARGIAYPVNLKHFAERLRMMRSSVIFKEKYYFDEVIAYIENHINAEDITEFQLQKLIEVYYLLEQGHIEIQQWYDTSKHILTTQHYKYATVRTARKAKKDLVAREFVKAVNLAD